MVEFQIFEIWESKNFFFEKWKLCFPQTLLTPRSSFAHIRGFGNSEGTLRTCPELPPTSSENFHFQIFGPIFAQFRCISRFEPKCSTFAQLRSHRHCSCQPDVALFRSGGSVGSLWERCGLVLTFPRPFLKTFIFVFSGTFLLKNGVSWDFDTFCPEMWDFVIYICYKKKWPPMWQLFSAKIKLALD